MKVLEFIPLGPFRVGAKQLSGLVDIGAESVEFLPPPSTALGALAAALERYDAPNAKEALRCKTVWGPLVKIEDSLYFESAGYLIPVGDVARYIEVAKSPESRRKGEKPRLAKYRMRVLEKPSVQLSRETKTSRAHFNVAFVWPYKVDEELREKEPVEVESFSVLYLLDCDVPTFQGAVRLGSEGRAAIVSVREDPALLEKLDRRPKSCGEGVLLTHLLFHGEGPFVEVGRARGLEGVEEVYGRLEGDVFKVRTGYCGLGFSVAAGRRRAIYQSLPPGTALRLARGATHAGLFTDFGYGSLLCP